MPRPPEGRNDIDYDGASGPVDLTDQHEPDNGVYDVWDYDAKGAYANVPGVAADQDQRLTDC